MGILGRWQAWSRSSVIYGFAFFATFAVLRSVLSVRKPLGLFAVAFLTFCALELLDWIARWFTDRPSDPQRYDDARMGRAGTDEDKPDHERDRGDLRL